MTGEIGAMTDSDAVLAANEAFYRAFSAGDMVAMEALWARQRAVTCSHPGWAVLRGRDAVMESWRVILESPGRPQISCRDAVIDVIGDAAFVTCYEDVDQGILAATNIFVREDGAWRMAHHQAGPTAVQAAPGVVH